MRPAFSRRHSRAHLTTTGVLLSVVVLLLPAPASGGTGRVVEREYRGFRGVAQGGTTVSPTLPGSTSVVFESRAEERSVRIVITDEVGGRVRALVSADTNGDGRADDLAYICGRSRSIAIPGSARVGVDLFAGTCADGEPSVPTAGVISATFR